MLSVPPWLRIGSEWALRLLLIAAGVVALGYALGYLRIVTLPIILALLATTLLSPPKRWLLARGLPAAAATLITMVVTFVLVAGIFAAIAPSIAGQLSDLGKGVESGARQATDFLAKPPFNLSERDIDRQIDNATEQLRANSGTITRGVTTGAIVVGEVLTGLFVTILLSFFFLKDGRRMWLWLVWLIGRDRQDELDALGLNIFRALSGYIRGIAIVGVINAVLIGLGLVIVGIPLVLPLMVLTFFGAFLPMIGAFLTGLAAVLIALVSNGPIAALIVLGIIVLVQQVEGHLLYPILMSRSVHLHPAVIVIALAAGGVIAGVIGVFLSVPVAAAASVAIRFLRGSPPEPDIEDPHEDDSKPNPTPRLPERPDAV